MNLKLQSYFNLFCYIVVILFFIVDITLDTLVEELGPYLYLEIGCVVLMFYLLLFQLKSIFKLRKDIKNKQEQLQHIQGHIIEHVNHTFNQWNLSKSEQDIGWLLLKGFSQKYIADIRSVSLKTIQQQCNSLYRKSQVANRNELISFFFEDFVN